MNSRWHNASGFRIVRHSRRPRASADQTEPLKQILASPMWFAAPSPVLLCRIAPTLRGFRAPSWREAGLTIDCYRRASVGLQYHPEVPCPTPPTPTPPPPAPRSPHHTPPRHPPLS